MSCQLHKSEYPLGIIGCESCEHMAWLEEQKHGEGDVPKMIEQTLVTFLVSERKKLLAENYTLKERLRSLGEEV